ncbi:MAG: LacI family DNA-binding transcriptional regulator, partial [Asticcacaulis sp.]|nr:LacI family DNA-binding transcriptional regulator [Asticcacaulis sp.]
MSHSESPTAPPARLKMSDVARLAGVSVSTVSRALAGSPLIPKPLRDKIEAIAEEAGYAVNHSARTLRMQTTRTIGVVLPIGQQTGQRATDPFLIEMVGHLTDEVIKRGYDLLISKAPAPRDGWLSGLIQSHRFDGMLMIGQSDQSAGLNDVARRYMPMVVWGERPADGAYCSVGVDNVYGGRLAADHLLSIGRRHIRFIGPLSVPEIAARHRGYLAALDSVGAEPGQPIISTLADASAYEAARQLIESGDRFDALFCASDVIAGGAQRALMDAGLRVPADVAVVGFDDVPLAQHMSPPLTTVR